MTGLEQVKKFAQEHKYPYVEFEKSWNGSNIYSASVFDPKKLGPNDDAPCVGYPKFIVVKDGKMRITDGEESLKLLEILYPEEYEDEEEEEE